MGVEVDRATADDGCTPLLHAAFQNLPDMTFFTPFLMSAQKCNLKITEIILEKRADTNKAAKGGQTPLFLAAVKGHKEVVLTLLAAGADKAVSTKWGTALSVARENGFHEIAALLGIGFLSCRLNWASAPK